MTVSQWKVSGRVCRLVCVWETCEPVICKVMQIMTAAFWTILQCVGLGGQEVDKWMLVCSVSKESWYAGSGIICSECSFLYIFLSLFAKMQNAFISSLHMQVFPLEFSTRCVGEVALQWTLCCSTSAAQNQTQPIIGAWCILRGMAQYCSDALWVF